MKTFGRILSAIVLLALASLAFAQAPTAPQGTWFVISPTKSVKLITLTAQAAGTVNSADQSGFGVNNILCVLNQSSHTGTPSTTFTIQNKDPISGNYYTILTSGATTADATPNFIVAGDGVAVTANVSANVPLSTTWRVQAIVAGTSPVVTGTVGCTIQQ